MYTWNAVIRHVTLSSNYCQCKLNQSMLYIYIKSSVGAILSYKAHVHTPTSLLWFGNLGIVFTL